MKKNKNKYRPAMGGGLLTMNSHRRLLMLNKKQNSDTYYEAYNLVFDGANYIDTGIKLYDTDKDFTIKVEFIMPQHTSDYITIFSSINESIIPDYPGIMLRVSNLNNTLLYILGKNVINNTSRLVGDTVSYEIVKTSSNYYLYIDGNHIVHSTYNCPVIDTVTTIGAGIDMDGLPFRFYNGIINYIKIEIK